MKLREFREIIVDHEASLRVRAAQNIAALVARAVDIVDEDRFLTAPVIETIEKPWPGRVADGDYDPAMLSDDVGGTAL